MNTKRETHFYYEKWLTSIQRERESIHMCKIFTEWIKEKRRKKNEETCNKTQEEVTAQVIKTDVSKRRSLWWERILCLIPSPRAKKEINYVISLHTHNFSMLVSKIKFEHVHNCIFMLHALCYFKMKLYFLDGDTIIHFIV